SSGLDSPMESAFEQEQNQRLQQAVTRPDFSKNRWQVNPATNVETLQSEFKHAQTPRHSFSQTSVYPRGANQPKLKVSEPDDKFEQEADRVAEIVTKPATLATSPAITEAGTNQSGNRLSRKEEEGNKEAELKFTSTEDFNSTTSGLNPGPPPTEEGFHAILLRWGVRNTGFVEAPEHVDRLTIYKADTCSGCRHERDEWYSTNVTVPATAPITQPGQTDY